MQPRKMAIPTSSDVSLPEGGFHQGSQICRRFWLSWPPWGRRAGPLSWLNFEMLIWYKQDPPRASKLRVDLLLTVPYI